MKIIPLAVIKLFISFISKTCILIILAILLLCPSLNAGPFLKIDRIDADSEFPKIRIFLTIRDLDKIVIAGLSEENISVYEDGFTVNYLRVKNLSEADSILYMVLGVDSSKSISAKLLKEIKKSAEDFLSYTRVNDMIALYRFNDEQILLNNFTNNRAEIIKNINNIERHGTMTLLYNALYDSIDLLNKTDIPRKAVVVFTDGKDEGSSIEINDVIEFAKESHIPVYCIAFKAQDRIKSLSRLTLLTGGKLFNSEKKDINAVYKTIVNSTKNQYLVEYKSMLEPDGKSHNVEVRLKYNNLKDNEQINIFLKKAFPVIRFPSISETLLIILVLILIILLIVLVIFFMTNFNKAIKASSNAPKYVPPYSTTYDKQEANDTDVRKEEKEDKKEHLEDRIHIKAWLVEREGQNAGKKYPVQFEENTIGRDKENRIIIDDKSVSKKHAKIKLIKNSFYLFDMASDKGTYLNENKLLRPKLLYDWDEIRIGKKIFIFRIANVA